MDQIGAMLRENSSFLLGGLLTTIGLTVLGFVASAPGFIEQPAVVDGASRLIADVFGPAGRHSRSAIGVAALPRGGAVEIEVEVALRR